MTAKHTTTKPQQRFLLAAIESCDGRIFCGSRLSQSVAQRLVDAGLLARVDALNFEITAAGRAKAEGRQP